MAGSNRKARSTVQAALIALSAGLSNFVCAYWVAWQIALGLGAVGALLVGLSTHLAGSKRAAIVTCILAPPVIAMTSVLVLAALDLTGRGEAFVFIFGAAAVFPSMVFGGIHAVLVNWLFDRHRDPSLEGFDRTLQVCGGWLACWAGISTPIAALTSANDPSLHLVWVVICLVASLTGAAMASIALLSRRRRRNWLQRVISGGEPQWSVMPRDAREHDRPIAPLFAGDDDLDLVIVRSVTNEHGGPFRSSEEREPYALISSAW